jgi:hypothetical protein
MTPYASFRHLFRAVPVALLAAFVLSACGSTVDATATEKDLKGEIPGLTETDLKVTSVTCPEDEDFKKGATFDCDYTVEDDTSGVAHVDVTSVKGDGKTVYTIASWASGQMAQHLIDNIEGDVALASVECPKTIEDGTVCTFEDEEGDTGEIALAFDAEGGFEWTPTYD